MWLGERENLTGLAAIQALMPICLSSFMAELAFSGAIFQDMCDTVFSLSLPLLMQLCRVNVAGSRVCMCVCICLEKWRPAPPTIITVVRLHYYLHVCKTGVSSSFHIWISGWRHSLVGLCSHNRNELQIPESGICRERFFFFFFFHKLLNYPVNKITQGKATVQLWAKLMTSLVQQRGTIVGAFWQTICSLFYNFSCSWRSLTKKKKKACVLETSFLTLGSY